MGPRRTATDLRRLSYILLAVGLAIVSTSLYFGTNGGETSRTALASQQPDAVALTVTATLTATATASAASPPEAPVEPLPEPEAPPEAAPSEAPPEPPAPPVVPPTQAPAFNPPAAPTSTPRPPAPPPPPPTATPVPPPAAPAVVPASLGGLEQSMLIAHNAERAAAGLAPLQADATLTQLARVRAQDMASKGYFSHTSPTGQTAFTLLGSSGYRYSLAGENLARNNYPDGQTVSVAMSGFMSSSSHRVNVLEPRFRTVGIGLATTAEGMKYFVVIFAAP